MNRNRSSTSATSSANRWSALLLALIVAGGLLRSLRLNWQPLWWDEGISVYFATESLPRMIQLTANDIHPPLYYALLHSWLFLFGSAQPAVDRLFSVLVGILTLPLMVWLARLFYPGRPRLALLAMILLVLSPVHLFYSQEVRMYVLAMVLGMVATAFFWLLLHRIVPSADSPLSGDAGTHRQNWPPRWLPLWGIWAGYVASMVLALYTIYYLAFLFLAHGGWALWHSRRRWTALGPLLAAYGATGALYLPWIIYTGGKLAQYVDDKVAADNDTPLGLVSYLYQHALAFTAGHLRPPMPMAQIALHAGLAALLLVSIAALYRTRKSRSWRMGEATGALWLFVLLPTTIGYVLNRNLPFFPDGGERLLLFMLPYVLLLLANGMDGQWTWRVGRPALILLLICAASGIATFYLLPRYSERDYRPLVAEMVERGRDQDTVLALFPWQVGYWRAYAPFSLDMGLLSGLAADTPGPRSVLAGQGSLEWGEPIIQQMEDALSQGTLWFPAPLALGSDLPIQIETHLQQEQAEYSVSASEDSTDSLVNLELRWVNPTTRLSAWSLAPTPNLHGVDADFGAIALASGGAAPDPITSANTPLSVALTWAPVDATADADATSFDVSLQLRDAEARVWATRTYRFPAPGSIPDGRGPIGLLVPAGLPPGPYDLMLSVRPASFGAEDGGAPVTDGVASGAADPLPVTLADGSSARAAPVARIDVTPPAEPLSPWRLPIQHALAPPHVVDGLALLGYAGYEDGTPWLAGDAANLTLFFQTEANAPERHLYISLLDEDGAGVAGWAGWKLPTYPTSAWTPGTLARVPVQFYLPATLPTGTYTLVAGLLDPATEDKSAPIPVDRVVVQQRDAQFEQPDVGLAIDPPVQLGSHAELIGYDWLLTEPTGDGVDAPIFELRLHWHVLQPLLPPHHIFVHADAVDAGGITTTLVQSDGPPQVVTNGETLPAPTGSWQPGEYLTTQHVMTLSTDVDVDPQTGLLSAGGVTYPWRVGLYLPSTGVRLPASINGAPSGDSVELASP